MNSPNGSRRSGFLQTLGIAFARLAVPDAV